MSDRAPRVGGVLETALYVEDIGRSIEFYGRVLGLQPASPPIDRLVALSVTEDVVLLLFLKGGSVMASETPFGTIPPTDGDGELHVAFSIPADEFDAWCAHLAAVGVEIESIVDWPDGGLGGRSIYFRDPDRHAIELKTTNWLGGRPRLG